MGRLAPWESKLFDELGISGRFVFTDPDIVPDEKCPLDAIDFFGEILDMYPERDKAGFGLRIDDVPDAYKFKQQVVIRESQFWERQLAPRLYDASIDTTFALYREPAPHRFDRAVRTGFPYVARHTPWYLDERSLPEDEESTEVATRGGDVNHWGRETLPPRLPMGYRHARPVRVLAPDPARRCDDRDHLGPRSLDELQARLNAVEDGLPGALRATKTFRYAKRIRTFYGRLRHPSA